MSIKGTIQSKEQLKGDVGTKVGISPVIEVEEDSQGYNISIIDVKGKKELRINHGAKGEQGEVSEEDLLKVVIKKTSEYKSIISIDDSAQYKVLDIGMQGKTEQEGIPSPLQEQEVINAGTLNEESGKYEVSIGIYDKENNPTKTQIITITSDRPITKWDKLVKRDGVIGWLYKGLHLTYDGSENWSIYNNSEWLGFWLWDGLPQDMRRRECFSNLCVYAEEGKVNNSIWLGVDTSNLYCVRNDLYDATLEDLGLAKWKAHLSENPLEIWTYSDTEEFVPLSEEEQEAVKNLTMYYPSTIISNNQEMPMQVTYIADVELFIEALSVQGVDLSLYAKKEEIPKKTSELENDSNFATQDFVEKDYVKNTDYAVANGNGGIVKVSKLFGFTMNGEYLTHDTAKENEINAKQGVMPLKIEQIDTAVKSGLAYCKEEWTEEEKASARDLLGITEMFGTYVDEMAELLGGEA